ncbi:MAG: thioredoxin family protein [Coprobacillus sp.]|nr:thioredoxin family protein [Coprobacillus sp.]
MDANLKKSGIDYISVNAEDDKYSDMLEKYNVNSVPTLLLFDDNDNLIKKHIGILTVDGIKDFIT